jgi:hypothetical protein
MGAFPEVSKASEAVGAAADSKAERAWECPYVHHWFFVIIFIIHAGPELTWMQANVNSDCPLLSTCSSWQLACNRSSVLESMSIPPTSTSGSVSEKGCQARSTYVL